MPTQRFSVQGRTYEIPELGRRNREGVYSVENIADPHNYMETRLVEQDIKVNGYTSTVNRVERGTSRCDVLLVGDSTLRPAFTCINRIRGSTVFISSWSGGKIKDIMALAFMTLDMGAGKRALVFTAGVNDILGLYKSGRLADPNKIDGEIRYVLKPLHDFIAGNRKMFRHLFATEVFFINENCRGVDSQDVRVINNTIAGFNRELTALIEYHGGEIIETSQQFTAGSDGIHLSNRPLPYIVGCRYAGAEPTVWPSGRSCIFLEYGKFIRGYIEKVFKLNPQWNPS